MKKDGLDRIADEAIARHLTCPPHVKLSACRHYPRTYDVTVWHFPTGGIPTNDHVTPEFGRVDRLIEYVRDNREAVQQRIDAFAQRGGAS